MALPIYTLRSVDIDGKLNQFFPDFHKLDLSPIFSQAGTVTFEYPEAGVNFSLLQDDMEIAILLDGVEVEELRCRIESTEGDDASEASESTVWTFTCHTLLGDLGNAVVYPPLWPTPEPLKHTYVAANAGKILSDMLGFAHTRGTLPWLTWDFTATHDSQGNVWGSPIDMEFTVGLKYTEVVQSLVDAGVVEVRIIKHVLQAFNPDAIGNDLTLNPNPFIFTQGRDMQSSPRKTSTKDLATTILLGGESAIFSERSADPATISTWGRRESYLSLLHVQTQGALAIIGDQVISTTDRPLEEITHGLNFDDSANPQPVKDFGVGDWVWSDVGRGLERHRVKQWIVSISEGSTQGTVTGSVVLNDLIGEQIAKIHRRLTNMENGTVISGPGTVQDDGRSPAAPIGINLSSTYYIDLNQARAVLNVGWSPVTTNSDGIVATNISGYAARWRYTTDDPTNWHDLRQMNAQTLATTFDNIATGRAVIAEVAAFNSFGRYGDWSTDVTATTATDTVAPPKPSSPTVTSNVGTLRVNWDGKDYQGQPQVSDFVGVEVHVGTDGAFTPGSGTLRDFLPGGVAQATTITSGLTYGTEYYVKLIAVDSSGNKSGPSDTTSTSHAILSQVVSTEIGTGQVGLANTAFSDVGNLIDDGSFEIASYRVARQSLITGTHIAFDNSTFSNGVWSLRSDSFSAGSTEYFTLQDNLPVKPGERIFGALDMRATSDTVGTVGLDIAWLNSAGQIIDNTGAVNSVFYVLGGLINLIKDNTWRSRINNVSQVAPPNAASMRLVFYTNNRTAGTVWADAIEVRRQIDTLLVADLAVTTAKIADLAVNNAKIANLDVGKLTTGTLNADVILGARIKTADTGQRVEINSSGIGAWNSGGTQTVNIATDGSVGIIGTLRSGVSGTRIEINPANVPTIRLYSGAGTEYGFINGFTVSGTDVGVGLNSSPFTGNGTQLNSRVVAFASQSNLEVIRADNQEVSGGYVWAMPGQVTAGYSKLANQGGFFQATATRFYAEADGSAHGYLDLSSGYSKMGINPGISSENTMYFDPGFTRHYGRWQNNPGAASNTQGLYSGRLDVSAGFSGASIVYGPTMATGMEPMVTIGSPTFDDTTGANTGSPKWGVSAGTGSTTQFSVGWDQGVSVAILFWCFRI